MAQSIKMPALGESVTEGTVTAWLKQVGDTVEVDEPIVEVATDKVDSEVPSPVAGVILEILVSEDETVEVGTEIARVGSPDEASGSPQVLQPEDSEQIAPVVEATLNEDPTPKQSSPNGNSGAPVDGIEVTMPALGESVTEGTVTAWLKQVGDTVEVDEPIVEVATDKVDSEVPSPVAGFLAEIRASEDDTVEVGTVIAVISANAPTQSAQSASAPSSEARPEPEPRPAAPITPPTPPAAPAPPVAQETQKDPFIELGEKTTAVAAYGNVVDDAPMLPPASGYVTPLVRKLAREKKVDLSTVSGTGIGGRIRKEDILAAAAPAPTPAIQASATEGSLRGSTEKMSRLRQTIARRMVESLQTAAQLTTVIEVDVTKIAKLRAGAKADFEAAHGTRLTFLPFFVKAAAEALIEHPRVNATISGNEVTYFDYENVGIAVDAPKGLMVPVIKNAGELNLSGIAQSINTLAAKVREGKISPEELTGSTFTITNTGSGGALFDTPVLNMPEVAILGVGAIVKRPMVVHDQEGNETIGIRSMVYLSLSYDHRLVDGADAARYLQSVRHRLEEGDFSADLGLS